ncbi:hypothetical protein [Thermoflexus sp.]|uniref:hypothetical protein n=2 Tax=Thermoflexus sp. TaxID=1969742 RepID=UPI0026010E8B|nr:hypothetical protein [Thermoflexus sp.]MCS6962733.1 S1 family peptidase [Thermoflexus sp.]MCX7690024.1 S1 family peptidase [Thermoflexus sp.]MDW8184051.1 hypothetical protein [Anaerolineae bacterium]
MMPEWQPLAQVKATHLPRLLTRRNVVGVGIGYKVKGGQILDILSVVVSVERKLPAAQLAPSDLIPPTLDGFPTDVVETGRFRAFQDPTHRYRPAPPGVSIGHPLVTAGTFGCLVRRGSEVFILSNNHVLAATNRGRPGDRIRQPGPVDGGTVADEIAELAEFVPIRFGDEPAACPWVERFVRWLNELLRLIGSSHRLQAVRRQAAINEVDAAIARPFRSNDITPAILQIGIPKGVATPTLGMEVQKFGRTTRYTRGRIIQVDVTANVDYDGRVATFQGQVMAGAMSAPGDSGSAILDLNGRLVGLLFAGSETTTLIHPIDRVLHALRVEAVVEG